jgi:hypothetical protein
MKSPSKSMPRRVGWRWRWLLDSPFVVAVWAGMLAMTLVVARASEALRAESQLQAAVDRELAALVAEQAAFASAEPVAGNSLLGGRIATRAGVSCWVTAGSEPGQLTIRPDLRDEGGPAFGCRLLAGMASPALSVPFAVCGDRGELAADLPVPVRFPAEAMPRLVAAAASTSTEVAVCGAIVRDDAIAMVRLPSGTDNDDFVLGGTGSVDRLTVPSSGVIGVPGNLWLDGARGPLALRLDRDALLVVRGNLYVSRSLQVIGKGRLYVFVVGRDGATFRDLDGNYRWSRGDELLTTGCFHGAIEGCGSAWFGLPQQQERRLELDAGIVVAGELHLGVAAATVNGPLVLRHGVTRIGGAAGALAVTGTLLPEIARQALPGFALSGPTRPSRLQPLDRSTAAEAGADQPLYPLASPR